MYHPARFHLVFVLAGIAFSTLLTTAKAAPNLFNYQGHIAAGGIPFDGNGQFKFALVNAAGDTTYWSHDGSSTAGGEPTTAVAILVSKGAFQVPLGDTTVANMTKAIPASLFADNDEVFLRIWFDDGSNGSEQLSPDRKLSTVPYAIVAARVPDGAIEATMIADGAITGTNIAAGTIDASHLSFTNGTISSITANGGLEGGGSTGDLNISIADGGITSAHLAPGVIAASLNSGDTGLRLETNPNAPSLPFTPALLAEIKDGVGGFSQLDGAVGVTVEGTTAYVASYVDDSLTIIDVSTPASPVLLAEIKDGVGGFSQLLGAWSVTVAGTTAYVASINDDSLTIIDVSLASAGLIVEDRVGIGTSTPTTALDVNGTITATDLIVNGTASKPGGGSWTALSDARTKHVLGDFQPGLSAITGLRTIHYQYRADNPLGYSSDPTYSGFVAQEVQKLIPEAVTERTDGFLTVNFDPIHLAAINAIKELDEKNQELDEKNQEKEKRLGNLEAENEAKDKEIKELKARLERIEKALGNR